MRIDMNKKKVSLKTCLLLCVICVLATVTVFGNTTMKEIVAYLNYSINICVDGEVKELKDAQGNRVYPISYNGTTYVPIRGVSDLLGVDITWDGTTNSVILETENYKDARVNLLNNLNTVSSKSYVMTDNKDKVITIDGVEHKFDNGVFCNMLLNQDVQIKDYVAIPISNDVKSVTFDGFANKRCSINIFNQQGKLLKTVYLQGDKLTSYALDVDSSVSKEIYFVVLSQDDKVEENNYAKILNVYGIK